MGLRMAFGKHKGMPIENLPDDYLTFIVDWMDSEASNWMSHSRKRLFDALDEELFRRKHNLPLPSAKQQAGTLVCSTEARKLLPEFIKSGYRAMSLKLHPDKGGSAEDFLALKELKDALEALAGGR